MRTTMLAGALLAALALAAPMAARAATVTHYGPPNAAAGSLNAHSVSGGAGTLPNEYPSPQPWSLARGDYCTAYKFAQPNAPTLSVPFLTLSTTNLAGLTGFDPGSPREHYQLRHNTQADSSACQARGALWGFWVNANTANNYCTHWCGVRHDYATGQATGTRPWSNGYGPNARLVMGAYRHLQTYSGNVGWAYVCAMLQDMTTSQRLEFCLRLWRSWSGPAYDPPTVFFNPHLAPAGGFANVVSDVTAAGTRYAQNAGGAATVLGVQPSGNPYAGAITRTHLVSAIADVNAKVKAANLGLCIGLFNGIRCYSADPDQYALLGIEDGLEMLGGATARIGGYSSGLLVYTQY